jgi:hypothetical protein
MCSAGAPCGMAGSDSTANRSAAHLVDEAPLRDLRYRQVVQERPPPAHGLRFFYRCLEDGLRALVDVAGDEEEFFVVHVSTLSNGLSTKVDNPLCRVCAEQANGGVRKAGRIGWRDISTDSGQWQGKTRLCSSGIRPRKPRELPGSGIILADDPPATLPAVESLGSTLGDRLLTPLLNEVLEALEVFPGPSLNGSGGDAGPLDGDLGS